MLTRRDSSPSTGPRLNPAQVALATAAAELRIARRTVRTWVFAALAIAVGSVVYYGWAFQHAQMGMVPAPRFALPGVGMLVLWVLVAGIVFLAFDIPGRDARERVADALDSRPPSNVALLGGRLGAVALVAWLPMLVLAVSFQVGGMVIGYLGDARGVSAEPVSLATLIFVDAPAALLFWGALVVLLAAVLRNRLVVALVALGLLATHVWMVLTTPLYVLPIVSGVANLGLPGSDILPRTVSGADLMQRLSVLVLAAGLLATAAAALPRRDASSRVPVLGAGAALLVLGGAGIGGLVWFVDAERAERVAWANAHEAAVDAPRADVERLTGTIDVDPDRELEIDVVLHLRTPQREFDELTFSLNPAMAVETVRVDGMAVPFRHELGILAVTPPARLAPGASAQLSIHAAGIPDPRFGYLDSSVWAKDETLLGMPIVLRGDVASIYEPNYVALTPAVVWLPMSGANFAIHDPSRRVPDFHDIDLVVRIPDGWHAAGPGRLGDDGVRFRPSVPLAQFPLIAAPLQRRVLTMGEIEYELLLHPGHLANLEYFSDAEREEETLRQLKQRLPFRSGPELAYPHAVFTVVETPGQLRRYGGGRIMDTIQGLPGLQMLPEHGFPTRHFSADPPLPFREMPEEIWLQQQLFSIEQGPHGVPALAGAARNTGPYLTSASGDGAIAANYLYESLTSSANREPRTVAPAHWLQIGLAPGLSLPRRILDRLMGTATFSFGWYQFFGMRLENRSAEFSFTGVDATATTEDVDILIHKGNLIALAVQGLMQRSNIADFLALMRARHGGGTFTVDEFIAAMSEIDPEMAPYIGHFMREDALPGFLVSDARAFRVPDADDGKPRYQVAVHVRNNEPVPGVAGLSVRETRPDGFGAIYYQAPFVHVPGNSAREFGVVTTAPPADVRLETYLSQNARVMRLALPRVDPDTIVSAEPFFGSRPSTWQPPDLGIVVDDLDSGYSHISPPPRGFRLGGSPEDDDAEMPEYNYAVPAPGWHRHGDPLTMSWGKYRRTLTRIVAGTGEGRATFATQLPATGTWRLYYHLPGESASAGHHWRLGGWNPGDEFGIYNLEIAAGEVRIPVAYDARMAVPGWNDIGTFELPAGPVSVTVSDATDGQVIVADAIRWVPLSTEDTNPAVDPSKTVPEAGRP
ncbi:MAG: hypothetical protein OXI79_10260 [Gammaproteobacteria bacterium]|nr:hypothetical protein [Gammaproteobacteria bacterium]